MLETKLIKVSAIDPERCKGIIPQGQCQYKAAEGSSFCIMHGGATNHIEKKKIRNYRLQKYQARVNELADSESIKSLREEIGILRMILEEVINNCNSTNDILLYSSKISDLCVKIEKLVKSCHILESNLGFMMDRQAVLNISTQIVNVISKHVPDETIIDNVINEIGQLIETS